jgi:lipoprotein-releasing system permease protein
MYKLFLCLRYLRSRLIAYFAVAAVGLCVAMMLIVISVMDGFVRKIEKAAKGLFSDIIVISGSMEGMGRYEEFIARLLKQVPDVQGASPFILTGGTLCLSDASDPRVAPADRPRPARSKSYHMVQIAGVEPISRAKVSDFATWLWIQKDASAPTFDPSHDLLIRRMRDELKRNRELLAQEKGKTVESRQCQWRITMASRNLEETIEILLARRSDYELLRKADDAFWAAQAAARGRETPELEKAAAQRQELIEKTGLQPPSFRAMLGLGLPGLSFHASHGDTVRMMFPGSRIALSVVPLGRPTIEGMVNERFTVIDDCETGVAPIDAAYVYVPFQTLQRLCEMEAAYDANDPTRLVRPARCTAIHVKVDDRLSDERSLRKVRDDVEQCWLDFWKENPDADESGRVGVYTWRQQQDKLVSQVEAQRTLVVIMFGVISLVAVVLIIVIFYMIVMQKTWDIGVLMAMGASRPGIAGIFLAYGAAVGLVGSVFGTVLGYVFVRHINWISDFIADRFGFRVWDQDFFMFRQIPNEVHPPTVVKIVVAAILAGLVGALIPALRAARMQPVEALRYE